MTEFEQQVRDALFAAIENRDSLHRHLLDTGGLRPITPEVFTEWLAPRVAAAITGAIEFFEVGDPRPFVFGGVVAEQAQAAALAALRGDK